MSAILLRHARAGDRRRWRGDDRLRPLDERGRKQAEALVALLAPFGLCRVVSSPYARCLETIEPLAAALRLRVEVDERLAEGAAAAAHDLLDGSQPLLACTHGDVIEALLGFRLRKAAAALVERGEDGALRASATIPAPD